jgi:hypothetical protein
LDGLGNDFSKFLLKPSEVATRMTGRTTRHPNGFTSRWIMRATPLNRLPGVHASSLYQVVFLGSSFVGCTNGNSPLGSGFALRCFQRFSFLDVAIQLWQRLANWHTSGPALSVLSY